MRRQLSLLLTLTAWLFATGSEWDVVQTFAWGRMIATHAETMTLGAAVRKTFDGEMCAICVAVQQARHQDAANDAAALSGKPWGKMVLACGPRTLLVTRPSVRCAGLAPDRSPPPSADLAAPPSPPPRRLA